VLGVWGFSELSNRISFLENVAGRHDKSITDIEGKMAEAQDKPISSDHVQNTSLRYIEERIAILQSEVEKLNTRVYQLTKEMK
jgi:uncharacterized small protein (DUF1192 family)